MWNQYLFIVQNLDSKYCVPMADLSKDTLLGGHCVLIIGYNDNDNTCLLCISWGNKWGNLGTFKLPYAYILDKNLTSDLFTISIN